MTEPSEKALAVRKRLLEDFEFWARNCWYIRTKDAKIVPLTLNRAQRLLLERSMDQLKRRGYIRLIILKGRQMGSSTFVEAFIYWWVSQREAQKALVVAHDQKGTEVIFTMTKRGHNKMPEHVKPHTAASSAKELVFDKLDSAYRIATAGGDGIVRGDTLTALHLSEAAWWPKGSALANHSGLMDALPSGRAARGTLAFEESTANSFNMFWEHWAAAVGLTPEVVSDWEPVFLPWFWDPSCEADPTEGFTRSPGEIELAETVLDQTGDELTDAHLMFRRLKIAEKGEDLFKQEYPSWAEEAFLTSGAPVFHADSVNEALKAAPDPIERMTLMPGGSWEPYKLGELHCFLPHDENETYYIGGDVGFGVGKDASVLQVLDSQHRQAAVWRSTRINADRFGDVAAALATFYNDAYLCVERNGPGILTNRVIHVDNRYANVHMEMQYDRITDEETEVVGFATTQKSKPLVVEELRAKVLQKAIKIYDKVTLEEMRRFIVSESGRYEAETGHHDDCVIALCLAAHVNEGEWRPIKTHDDWFAKYAD